MKTRITLAILVVVAAFAITSARESKYQRPSLSANGVELKDAAVQYGMIDNRLAIVVASQPGDISKGVATSYGQADGYQRIELNGSREIGDHVKTVSWKLVSADGLSGTVTVNDQQFRLEDGGLFFVEQNSKVRQVKIDLARMTPGDDTWSRLLKVSSPAAQ